jgi:hypothetical protein
MYRKACHFDRGASRSELKSFMLAGGKHTYTNA